jgi:hypothetical protein
VQAAAQAIGLQLIIIDVNNNRDIETAIASFVQRGAGALLVGAGAFLTSKRARLAVGLVLAGPIAHQPAGHGSLALHIHRGDGMARR